MRAPEQCTTIRSALSRVALSVVLCMSMLVESAHGADVTFAWDPPTPSTDVVSYMFYYKAGLPGPPYDGTDAIEGSSPIIIPLADLAAPATPRFTLHGLNSPEPYYAVITARFAAGLESPFSNEVMFVAVVDSDSDGLSDHLEVTTCTDPFNADTDGDGLLDGQEDANANGVLDPGETNPCNGAPIAAAGPDQTVRQGETVLLNGASSTDPDDGIASCQWIQTAGIPVALSSASSTQATFVAPQVDAAGSSLMFQVTVTDRAGQTASDFCIVTVTSENAPPVADAGPDQTVTEGTVVALDGSNSSDPDDVVAAYRWVQTGGAPVALSSVSAVRPTFTAPAVATSGTSLVFQLTVTDGGGLQAADSCIVNVTWVNEPPVAMAGADQMAPHGSTVTLDGSGSYDRDDGIKSFRWTQSTGTPVALSGAVSPRCSFSVSTAAPVGEVLVFQLTVVDSEGLSGSDECSVAVVASVVNPDLTGHFAGLRKVGRGSKAAVEGTLVVQNAAPAQAGRFIVAFYLSRDATLDSTDMLLGQDIIESVAGEGSTSLPFRAQVSWKGGAFYVVGRVDALNDVTEANENNNMAVGGPLK